MLDPLGLWSVWSVLDARTLCTLWTPPVRLLVTVIQLGQSRVVTPSIAHPAAVIVTHHPVPSRLPGRPVVAVPLPLAQRSFARLAYSLPPIRFRLSSGDGWEPLAERSGDVLGIVPPTLGEWWVGPLDPARLRDWP